MLADSKTAEVGSEVGDSICTVKTRSRLNK